MAKDKSKKADTKGKAKEDAKTEKAAEREFKYGVEDLAETMGLKPASVRVQLRNHSIEKAGKSYGWNSKKDLDEVIAQLKADKPEKAEGKKAGKGKKADAAEGDAADGKKKDKKNKKK